MRIDKFLWCVRLFKTRALATDAVRQEHVHINGRVVKASTEVKPGELVAVRVSPIWRSWEVLALPTSRVGARLVPTYLVERTSFEDLDRLHLARMARAEQRPPGTGRPTKRDRRAIDHLRGDT